MSACTKCGYPVGNHPFRHPFAPVVAEGPKPPAPESPYVPLRNEAAQDPPPKRAFVLELNIGADQWDDVVHELRELADHIATHGPGCGSVGGGCTSGHWVHVHVDPTMTSERYHAESRAWLDRKKAAKAAEGGG